MGNNLLLQDIYIRDPYVLVDNGFYYLYGTTDEQCWKGKGFGFKAYKSKDLKSFQEYIVFKPKDNFWGYEQFWAPEVHKIGGKYIMFATFSKGDDIRRVQLLEASNPLGPFEPLNKPLFSKIFSHLDATYYEDNGKKYCFFSHEWTECRDGEMCVVELDNQLSPIGDYKVLFKASSAPWVIDKEKKDCYVTDGPYIYKSKTNKYIMLWSSHGKKGYAMGQAVSDNILGPYEQLKEPIINKDGGHGMIFKKEDKLYISFHKPNEPHMKERAHFERIYDMGDYIKLAKEE